jgi:hypothetical protein
MLEAERVREIKYMPMSEAALEAAAKVGLLKPDSNVLDRQATTKRIIDYLSEQPVADLFGVETVAQSIEEVTTAVFHSDDEDLRAVISQLCSLRATGQVQHTLNGDGRMLCGRRTTMILTMADGSTVKHGVTQRFVSSDPEVVTRFLLNQRLGSLMRQAKESDKILTLTAKRIPALAAEIEQRRLTTTLEVRALLSPEAVS